MNYYVKLTEAGPAPAPWIVYAENEVGPTAIALCFTERDADVIALLLQERYDLAHQDDDLDQQQNANASQEPHP